MNADAAIILGVNLSHDTACAAVVGGEVKVAIAEERLTRVKHNSGITEFGKMIPFRSIRYCCDSLDIRPDQVDLWVATSCRANAIDQLRGQLLGIPPERVIDVGHPGHHLAHAYSAFYCSGFDRATTIVLDTNGSFIERSAPDGVAVEKKEHFGCYAGDGDGLRLVRGDFVFPGEISIGELYCIYSAALQLTPIPGPYGFDCPLSSGGKLMALAAYDGAGAAPPGLWSREGDHLKLLLARLVEHLRAQGVVERATDSADLAQIYGFQIASLVRFARRRHSLRDQRYLALAGEAQALLEQLLLQIARQAQSATDHRSLCLAGGTMLNVIAVTRLLAETPFEKVFVQPAAGDAGTAIGAALFGYYCHLGGRRRPYLTEPYSTLLGREYSSAEIHSAVARHGGGFTVRPLATIDAQVDALVPRLLNDEIVALFNGRSEFGPRALGSRSLLASPQKASMRQRMNQLKGREWYRPVAPIVTEESFDRFFAAPFTRSPFMTLAATCQPLTRERAPAICHVDNTARPQTVSRESNPFLHRLLSAFEQRTSLPILINTSFNRAGEPIVETPEDALRTFQKATQIPALLLGDLLLEKA